MQPSLLTCFMTQKWEDLLLLHWPVPIDLLASTIPDDLELDLHEGKAWASVVGFKLSKLRIAPFSLIPWNDFWEVNLRTYVRDRNGRKGVWFYSLDSSDTFAVFGARTLYGLSYHKAEIIQHHSKKILGYDSKRKKFGNGASAYFEVELTEDSETGAEQDSGEDVFLLERYRFWAKRTLNASSTSATVHHKPYRATRLLKAKYKGELFRSQGLPEPPETPPVVHYCRGFDVTASAPSWLYGIAGQANQR